MSAVGGNCVEGSDLRMRGVMPEDGSTGSVVDEVEKGGIVEVMRDRGEEAIEAGDICVGIRW
jgi:hypothetical protein